MSLPSPVRVPILTQADSAELIDGRRSSAPPSSSSLPPPPPPSRVSLEFAIVVIPLLCICAYGTYCPMRASYLSYTTYKDQLDKPDPLLQRWSRGVIRGYDVEGDPQWRSYSHFTPLFIVLFGAVGLGSRVLRACRQRVCHRAGSLPSPSRRRSGSAWTPLTSVLGQWWALPLFHVVVGVVFVAILHGPHFVFTIAAALVNYAVFRPLQRRVPYWLFALLMWASHVTFLYVAEAYNGFEAVYWVQYWLPSSRRVARAVLPPSMHDTAVPLWDTLMRWQQLARMSTLRMIAFNYDLWEASHMASAARRRAMQKHRETCLDCARLRWRNGVPQPGAEAMMVLSECDSERHGSSSSSTRSSRNSHGSPLTGSKTGTILPLDVNLMADKGNEGNNNNNNNSSGVEPSASAAWDESLCCYKCRTEYPRELSDYNLLYYLAFVLFSPLYLAGPMMSYNAFVSFLKHPTRAMPAREMGRYIVRILVVFMMAYLTLHLVYVHTMTADLERFRKHPIQAQALLLYWYLTYLWLKFAFLWRTSRLYAIWSGIEPPEDMRRCFSDTLTIQDFWRDWHASFNLWIVRYMYIPMGGRARIMYSLWPIFFFIAVWHDHRLHLLQWAVLIVISFIVELGSHVLAARYLVKPVETAMASLSAAASCSPPARVSAPLWARRVAAQVMQWQPSTRQTVWRAVRGVAGASTILSLIAINLIGFLVQTQLSNTASSTQPRDRIVADGKESQTDRTVAEILFTPEHAFFALCVMLVMVIVGVHNVFYRDRRACLEATERYALRAARQLGQ